MVQASITGLAFPLGLLLQEWECLPSISMEELPGEEKVDQSHQWVLVSFGILQVEHGFLC